MQMTLSQRVYRCCSIVLGLLTVLCWTWQVAAQETAEVPFYQQQKEGWFWYEDPAPVPEEQVAERLPQENRFRYRSLDEFGLTEVWNMYPDDFQELLNHVQNVAVQEPTEDNLLRYLVMQDVARRKALAYTNASMYVTQKYSELLGVNQVYPTAKPGVAARIEMQRQEMLETISRARSSHALIYFTRPGCGFCSKQNGILHYFVEKYGWQVKPVDISKNPNLAARFAIESVPALLLISKGQQESMAVSVGVVTLSELERKLFRAIRHLEGVTEGETFLLYDFQQGTGFDPASILSKGAQPWKRN